MQLLKLNRWWFGGFVPTWATHLMDYCKIWHGKRDRQTVILNTNLLKWSLFCSQCYLCNWRTSDSQQIKSLVLGIMVGGNKVGWLYREWVKDIVHCYRSLVGNLDASLLQKNSLNCRSIIIIVNVELCAIWSHISVIVRYHFAFPFDFLLK